MNQASPEELDVPAIMRIGAARMAAGLDRMTRLDLTAQNDVFGPLPRMSADEIVAACEQVDLRGQGGAGFPFARKLQAVMDASKKKDQPAVVVVNCTEGEPGSFKDKMLMIRSPYLILSGAALVAEAIGAEEIIIGVTGNELANQSMEAAIAAEPALAKMVRVVQAPEKFISGESAGQCGPCKLGLPSVARAMQSIVDGAGGVEALDTVADRPPLLSQPPHCAPRSFGVLVGSWPRIAGRGDDCPPGSAAGRKSGVCVVHAIQSVANRANG